MPLAVGVIETLGVPGIIAAADAMVKSGRVTLVYFGQAESARLLVAIRGTVSEVRPAVEAGIEAVSKVYGGKVETHYIVPNPPENLEAILPIKFSKASEPFRV